jgi:DEAD/DEAH box helicase domain-containing protein
MPEVSPIDRLLDRWRKDPENASQFVTWRTTPPRPTRGLPLPEDLPATLTEVLTARGITRLYSHQAEAWEHSRAGENLILATGTASGKTLAYNLPILSALVEHPEARALYLFPTKALTQDQFTALERMNIETSQYYNMTPAVYDGDTPQARRPAIRKNARLLLTNPDMLHTGILPHHTNWVDFFRDLRFVVIDEMHTYRGVFGSHVANVIRRLKRVAAFYGASPQFILTSATIGNPDELAERLIEEPVTLIDQDGSGRGERHFLIYNPLVIDPALGLRKSALLESVRLAQDLLSNNIQSVVFARSRRSVEIILTYLQGETREETKNTIANSSTPNPFSPIRGYRSGYLPSQRREIEGGLRDGTVKLVIATNALELGIDIGGLGAALLVGYPGTIASTWQQAGRAGRGDDPAAAVLITTPAPLDQFLAHHPDYFFGHSPEQALINPDHLLILLEHLRCAAFELPFRQGEGFGRLPSQQVEEFLQVLTVDGELHVSGEKYFWMADAYPAANVSLRSASPDNVVLQTDEGGQPRTLGEVDLASASWMVHPRAIYMHEGQQYYVQELNLESYNALLIPVALDYYTEPQRRTEVSMINRLASESLPSLARREARGAICEKAYGGLQVTEQIVGFKKLRWFTNENLGEEPLDLPPSEFQTTGYWLTLSESTIAVLRASGAWSNDPNDYGPDWPRLRDAVRARDGYRCRVCGQPESDCSATLGKNRQHEVHHKVPFRAFGSATEANRLDNLVTLCPTCHHKVEQNVRMRSGLAGLSYVLGQLAPLFLMCDPRDLGVHSDPQAPFAEGQPAVVLYDLVPAGIGFSQKLFEMHNELMQRALELVKECPCQDGCPSCVGPGGENGYGGKREALAILRELAKMN